MPTPSFREPISKLTTLPVGLIKNRIDIQRGVGVLLPDPCLIHGRGRAQDQDGLPPPPLQHLKPESYITRPGSRRVSTGPGS